MILRAGFLIFLSLATLSACSPKTDSAPAPVAQMTGGQDGGGGEITLSTLEQVKTALKQSIEWATNPDFETNVFARFYFDQYAYIDVDPIEPKYLFPNMINQEELRSRGGREEAFNAHSFESPALLALKTNKITILDKGDCPSPENKHADASVTAMNLKGELCFSAGNLTRIPPTALLKTVLGLVLHEVLHLGGAPEQEAQKWQEGFNSYFDVRYAGIGTENAFLKIQQSMHSLRRTADGAERLFKKNPNDPRIFTQFGILLRQLAGMPYILDAPMLEYSKGAARPWLKNNFVNAVIAITEELWEKFGTPKPMSPQGKVTVIKPFVPMSPAEMKTFIFKLQRSLDVLDQNLYAYTWGGFSGDLIKSTCVLPKGPLPDIFFDEELKTVASYGAPPKAPPRVCDEERY